MAVNTLHRTPDGLLELKDAGAITADDWCQVSSTDAYIDLGANRCVGVIEVDVTAIEIDSNTEKYDIWVEGSNETTFNTTLVPLACLSLGPLETRSAGSSHILVDSTVGKYKIYFSNEQAGTVYRYVRLYVDVDATGVTTGINFKAYATIIS